MHAEHPIPGIAADIDRAQRGSHIGSVIGMMTGIYLFTSLTGGSLGAIIGAAVGGAIGGADLDYALTPETIGAAFGLASAFLISEVTRAVTGDDLQARRNLETASVPLTLVGRTVFHFAFGQRPVRQVILENNPHPHQP